MKINFNFISQFGNLLFFYFFVHFCICWCKSRTMKMLMIIMIILCKFIIFIRVVGVFFIHGLKLVQKMKSQHWIFLILSILWHYIAFSWLKHFKKEIIFLFYNIFTNHYTLWFLKAFLFLIFFLKVVKLHFF